MEVCGNFNLNQIRRWKGLFLEKITTPKIDIGKIALIYRKSDTGFGSTLIDHASRVFFGSTQKRARKDQLAAHSALNAFPAAVLYLLFDSFRFKGTKK